MKKAIKDDVYITEDGRKSLESIHFSDTFSTTNSTDDLKKITQLIFGTMPAWIVFLFKIRDKIGRYIGFKQGVVKNEFKEIKEGKTIGFFTFYKVNSTEIILGADDHHLNFRALINNTKSRKYNIKVTTLVQYHNKKGVVYMRLIKPFHELVVKHMVQQAFKDV